MTHGERCDLVDMVFLRLASSPNTLGMVSPFCPELPRGAETLDGGLIPSGMPQKLAGMQRCVIHHCVRKQLLTAVNIFGIAKILCLTLFFAWDVFVLGLIRLLIFRETVNIHSRRCIESLNDAQRTL